MQANIFSFLFVLATGKLTDIGYTSMEVLVRERTIREFFDECTYGIVNFLVVLVGAGVGALANIQPKGSLVATLLLISVTLFQVALLESLRFMASETPSTRESSYFNLGEGTQSCKNQSQGTSKSKLQRSQCLLD